MALGGRPPEEGGHKPLKISVNKFVSEALEKVPNKSKFLEEVARPVLEKMDPGEASVFLWKIDILISQGIVKATQEKDFKQIQTLGWLASCLEDARSLCGVPPPDFEFSLPKETPIWKKQASEDLNQLKKDIANRTGLELIPEATVLFLKCNLPSYIKEKLKVDIEELENRIVFAKAIPVGTVMNPIWIHEQTNARLKWIATKIVPQVLDKVATLIFE